MMGIKKKITHTLTKDNLRTCNIALYSYISRNDSIKNGCIYMDVMLSILYAYLFCKVEIMDTVY